LSRGFTTETHRHWVEQDTVLKLMLPVRWW
jgi:hypothetical protein